MPAPVRKPTCACCPWGRRSSMVRISARAWIRATPKSLRRQSQAKPAFRVLPALLTAFAGTSRRWPGTIALQPQTVMNTVVEIFDWLHGAGFKRLIIVNGHVAMRRAALRAGDHPQPV